jgi:hypothetical protein
VILQIVAGVLAGALLLGCIFGGPLLLRRSHEAMLRSLGMEGVTIVPGSGALSGLRIERPKWKAEVAFEPPRVGGGRPGHLRYLAEFRGPVPLVATPDARLRTGDDEFDRKISVEGDPAFAKKLLSPLVREKMMRLDEIGGRVDAIGEGTVEISGRLPRQSAELRKFLELCGGIVDATVTAAGA